MYESIMGVVHYVVGFQSEKEVVDLLGWDVARRARIHTDMLMPPKWY